MDHNNSNIIVSPFDYSIENHFNAMNTIRNLCGRTMEEGSEAIDETELERFNSRITFLRQWRDYYYRPRVVRFGCQTDSQQGRRDVIGEVNLPQFSAATVPKKERLSSNTGFSKTSNDFVLYVGGHVWSLDWCPAVHQQPDCHMKCEYLAVAAHPPEASYHKIGTTLIGRGVVQIWCVLHAMKEEVMPPTQRGKTKKLVPEEKCILPSKRPRGRPRKCILPSKRPRGRPRKKSLEEESFEEGSLDEESLEEEFFDEESLDEESLADSDTGNESVPSAAKFCSTNEDKPLSSKKARGRPKKQMFIKESLADFDTGNDSIPDAAQLCSTKEDKPLLSKKARGRPKKLKFVKESLAGVDTGNESVPDVVQLCSTKEDRPLPLKKRRGRPKKLKIVKESLVDVDTGNESVPDAAQLCKTKEDKPLSLKKGRGRPRKLKFIEESLVDIDTGNKSVPDAAQFCSTKEDLPLPSNKARGRPKKRKYINESLAGTGNKSVSALSVDIVSSGFLALTEGTTSTEEHALLKSCDTDVGLDDSNRENQIVQATEVQLSNVKEIKPLLSKTPKGRQRKKKDIEDFLARLETEEESVPALAVDDSQVSSGYLAPTEATRATEEHALLKSRDADVRLIDSDTKNESVLTPAADISQVPSGPLSMDEATRCTDEHAPPKNCDADVVLEAEILDQCCYKKPMQKRKMKGKTMTKSHADGIAKDEDKDSCVDVLQEMKGCGQDTKTPSLNVANSGSLEVSTSSFDPPEDVALPRVVLCLAHNGKVTWDVKWQPTAANNVEHTHRMGYLAVLLGNGSLEVWEVPSLKAIEILYSSCKKEGTDPRFVKLEPVFRCSKLESGDRLSIPLTVEWSTSSPHDLLLAGCHDGTVALWKFSASASCQDTRPLLCFSADTLPIRALAWAPDESDEESANVVVTAGHGGVRFWDLRDPYRPLWDVNPVRRFIYSLDWLQNPRCVIMSYDDGTLRILSLSKAAYDVPVTGKPFAGTQLQGLHYYSCLTFPIWSVQASRLTGQVVYCSSDGSVLHFQLTSKAVEKDPSRNRAPHFLCGALAEEEETVVVNTPLPNIPFPLKKSQTEWGDTPRSIRGLSGLNQAKRANDQTSDPEPLALCYNDDPFMDFGSEDMTPVAKARTTKKTSKKKKADPDSAQADDVLNQEKVQTDVEVFPPKIVAMHRVRWNMNKGSERWLCYGGAAGIVRCQEISASSTPARLLVKK